MRVVITGGSGFIGRKLAARLLARGALAGADGRAVKIGELVLFDREQGPALPQDRRLSFVDGDIAEPASVRRVIAPGTQTVFHLAAVVSAEAEADTDLGMRVNLDGTRVVLEACRALGTVPRLVFASSIAVYGGDMPPVIDDATALTPQTSYGSQKACGELLVNDFSRKGYIDGRALRLPTIVVRPGRPNRAASTFASSIIREPLAGQPATCPVALESEMPLMSPRCVVAAFERAHDLPAKAFGAFRALLLPGLSVTVGGMLEALERAGGRAARDRVKLQQDPVIQRIVDGWPRRLAARRAEAMGIHADASMDEIVAAFIADDLPAQKALAGAQS